MENRIDDDLDNMLAFLEEAIKGLKWGEHKYFVCPICGGRARSGRASNNGHCHASCNKCGANLSV